MMLSPVMQLIISQLSLHTQPRIQIRPVSNVILLPWVWVLITFLFSTICFSLNWLWNLEGRKLSGGDEWLQICFVTGGEERRGTPALTPPPLISALSAASIQVEGWAKEGEEKHALTRVVHTGTLLSEDQKGSRYHHLIIIHSKF